LRQQQKKIEKREVIEFISNPKLELIVTSVKDSETPDFIIEILDNSKISIEHTRFINAKNKQIEVFRKWIIDEAKALFEKEFNVALDVYIHFSRYPMNVSDYPKKFYINLLYNLIKDVYLSNHTRDFYISTNRLKKENKYIDSISVSNNATQNRWQSIGGFLVDYADLNEVQCLIDHKSSLISNYHQDVDEKWLLVIFGIGNKSSGYRFEHISLENLSKNGFDRLFFYDSRARDYIELA
jgi:hypothetical protein